MKNGPVAYLVLAYHKPVQLLRLLGRLRAGSPAAPVHLHMDAKAQVPEPASLRSLEIELVEPRVDVQWGDFSFVQATLTGLRSLLEREGWQYVYVISGQDYPLRPLAEIEHDVLASGVDAFLDVEETNPFVYRYGYRYISLPRLPRRVPVPARIRQQFRRVVHWLNSAQPLLRIQPFPRQLPWRLGVRRIRSPFGPAFPCRFGSDWFTLSRRAVEHVLATAQKDPALVRVYQTSIIPSESFFVTVLCNSQLRVQCRDNRRFILWPSDTAAHPVTLTMEHLHTLLHSAKDFGRKFDMDTDSQILDALDERIGFASTKVFA